MTSVTLELPDAVYAVLAERAREQGVSVGELLAGEAGSLGERDAPETLRERSARGRSMMAEILARVPEGAREEPPGDGGDSKPFDRLPLSGRSSGRPVGR